LYNLGNISNGVSKVSVGKRIFTATINLHLETEMILPIPGIDGYYSSVCSANKTKLSTFFLDFCMREGSWKKYSWRFYIIFSPLPLKQMIQNLNNYAILHDSMF
jgi:hypothetical protein